MRTWVLVLSVAAAFIAIPLACIAIEYVSMPSGGEGSVVLVEHLSQIRGRLVNGTYPAAELEGKAYAFDMTQKVLDGGGLVVNDTLKAVVGISRSLAQDAGTGAAGAAYGIYGLPSAVEGITVHDVASDGTVTLSYNGTRIVLAPGARWERISTDAVSTPDYSIRLTKADGIRNNGFVSLATIR
ncbi:MAG: hypothetical protein A4E28_02633 [Methanocella sp. PtaU1.Bin125]|nr:MAG: hypothetical protein A4E28_02633 [Methanocella sp. PtaU1.Bin125]